MILRTRHLRLPLLLTVALLTQAGCGPSTPHAGKQVNRYRVEDTPAPPAQQVLRRSITGSPTSLDPALGSGMPSADLLTDLFEGLVTLGADGRIQPGVARSWTISKDGLTYTFAQLFLKGAGYNDGGYDNPAYDALIQHASAELDPARRYALYGQASEILNHDAPFIPLYTYMSHNLVKPYVAGVRPSVLLIHPSRYIWIRQHSVVRH